jgi:hypothetical protein
VAEKNSQAADRETYDEKRADWNVLKVVSIGEMKRLLRGLDHARLALYGLTPEDVMEAMVLDE